MEGFERLDVDLTSVFVRYIEDGEFIYATNATMRASGR